MDANQKNQAAIPLPAAKPRSEKRQRTITQAIKWKPSEWDGLLKLVADANAAVGAGVSARVRMTPARLVREAALTAAIKAPGRRGENPEVGKVRADLARFGNMLKTWIERGGGPHRGKGPEILKAARDPTPDEQKDGLQLMKLVSETLNTLNAMSRK